MKKKLFYIILVDSLLFVIFLFFFFLNSAESIKELNEKIKGYEYVGNFHDGLAAVVKNGKIGFINKSGDLEIPMKWDVDIQSASRLDEYVFNNGRCYIPPTINFNAHIIDKKGNVLYSGYHIRFEKTRDFDVMYVDNESGHSTYFVKKDDVQKMEPYENDYAVIERNWNYNDPDEYKSIYFSLEKLCDGNIVNKKTLEEKYGYRVISNPNSSFDDVGLVTLYNIQTNKYGIVDEKGNIVVPFQYDNNICLYYGLLIEILSVRYNSDIGLDVIPVCYNVYKDGRLLYEHLPKFSCFYASMGMILFNKADDLDEWWNEVPGLDERDIPKVNNETKWLDINGNEVTRFQFGKNYLRPVDDRCCLLEDEGGRPVYPNQFEISSRFQNKIMIEDRNPYTYKVLFLTDTGDTIPFQYADYLKAGVVKMRDKLPSNIYPLCAYKNELCYDDNYLNCHFGAEKIKNNDEPYEKFKIVRWNGLELLPFDVDEVSYFSEGLLRIKLGNRYFFIDEKGNGLIEN